ncbi:MAG: pyridoxamine kinase [Eubacteriales bacterium]|nr:pyridoxamine kinase [Clostridiales bacterium]MDY5835955.1 pyridoxamine kinase [Eubacteriales bacterium]
MSQHNMSQSKVIPRVAAIHDLCGYGNCSLVIVLGVLSAAGLEVCPVPTSYLAAHTAFPVYSFVDTTPHLREYLAVWDQLEVQMAGAYSGFLGSAEQITIFSQLFDRHPDWDLVVDPCMADHGKRYKTYTDVMCQQMTQLCQRADLILPNMTEAAILLGRPYPKQNLSRREAEDILDALLDLGAKNVILKGIERGDGQIVNALKGEKQAYCESAHPLLPYKLHGTGDLFASIVASAYFRKVDLDQAMILAGEMLVKAMELSRYQEGYQERGVSYEPLLVEIGSAINRLAAEA